MSNEAQGGVQNISQRCPCCWGNTFIPNESRDCFYNTSQIHFIHFSVLTSLKSLFYRAQCAVSTKARLPHDPVAQHISSLSTNETALLALVEQKARRVPRLGVDGTHLDNMFNLQRLRGKGDSVFAVSFSSGFSERAAFTSRRICGENLSASCQAPGPLQREERWHTVFIRDVLQGPNPGRKGELCRANPLLFLPFTLWPVSFSGTFWKKKIFMYVLYE